MEISIDMLALNDADSILIWAKDNGQDYVTIIDGGNPGDGQKLIDHFKKYVEPHIPKNAPILVINTHPHRDHIGGLIEIVNFFKQRIARFYFNNPADYIEELTKKNIRNLNESIGRINKRVSRVFESINDANNLMDVLAKYNIQPLPAFSDTELDHNLFRIVGPSKKFYLEQLAYFTNIDILKTSESNIILESQINELEEGLKPCQVVDDKNDVSAENLTSVLTEFNDASGRRYLFTADSGVDSFENAEANGFDMTNFHICQLPHHGSRRNISTNWIGKLNPSQFWVSASGNKKHPRKAVIECIKKNLPNCRTYGTHKGGTKHINSNDTQFPARNWSSAKPL